MVNAGGQRADVAQARGTRGGRVGRMARGVRVGAWECGARERVGAWHAERVRARGDAWEHVERVSGEPETSGGAWGRVRGQIRPILVSMDRS